MGSLGCRKCTVVVLASSVWLVGTALGDEVEPNLLLGTQHVLLKGVPGAAARRAVRGARLRLLRPSCARLLSEFSDASRQPLQSHLDPLGLTAPEYLGFVLFVEGSSRAVCTTGDVLGATRPGSRVVALCGAAFAETERTNPRLAEALVIHEMLHSLGLGENPPSSREITARVLKSCQERAASVDETHGPSRQ